jgi:hypothetical protein
MGWVQLYSKALTKLQQIIDKLTHACISTICNYGDRNSDLLKIDFFSLLSHDKAPNDILGR